MLIEVNEVEPLEPAALSLDQWNNFLYAHYFEAGHCQARAPVSRIHVSGQELAVAIRADACSVESVRTAFVSCIQRNIGNRSLAVDASRRREAWLKTCNGVPSYLSHLLLTCMVVNDLAEELQGTGDFRKRLSRVLGDNKAGRLELIRTLWKEFAAWTAIQELKATVKTDGYSFPKFPIPVTTLLLDIQFDFLCLRSETRTR